MRVERYRAARFDRAGERGVSLCQVWQELVANNPRSGEWGAKWRMRKLHDALREYRQLPFPQRNSYRFQPLHEQHFRSAQGTARGLTRALRSGPFFSIERYARPWMREAFTRWLMYLSRGGRLHFFDPDSGEYIVPRQRVVAFLVEFTNYAAQRDGLAGIDLAYQSTMEQLVARGARL